MTRRPSVALLIQHKWLELVCLLFFSRVGRRLEGHGCKMWSQPKRRDQGEKKKRVQRETDRREQGKRHTLCVCVACGRENEAGLGVFSFLLSLLLCCLLFLMSSSTVSRQSAWESCTTQ